MARCSICGTLVQPADATASCPECKQEYHEGCWADLGGCATYGCKAAARAEKAAPPAVVGAGWGDEKECPACDETIASSRLVCVCGAVFPWAEPMTQAEYIEYCAGQEAIASARRVLLTLFVVSLSIFASPLSGPAAGIYAYRTRTELAGAGGVYLAMGYGSAILGVTYVFACVALWLA
jgi:hypothetical protein